MKGRRPTQVDVARLAGVSRQTVSLVSLDDARVSPAKRSAVLEAMKALGYRPNVVARALASRRTGFVGISLYDLINPFHGELISTVRRRCEAEGLIPFIAPVDQNSVEERAVVGRFLQMNVDGLILISPLAPAAELDLIGRQVPTVVVTRNSGPDSIDLVHTDDLEGGRIVADQMVDAGYRPVVYLGVDRDVEGDSSHGRVAGYRAAMAAAGIPAQVEMLAVEEIGSVIGALAARYGTGFGLCCHNDLIAVEAMRRLLELGLEPGRDVGVAGFDNTGISSYPRVSLTTVDQSTEEMAGRAVDLLVQRMAGRTERVDVILPPRLVVRSSTSPRT